MIINEQTTTKIKTVMDYRKKSKPNFDEVKGESVCAIVLKIYDIIIYRNGYLGEVFSSTSKNVKIHHCSLVLCK